ncbi:MAG: septation protein IspZ [Alphaproteobacteria bacterium]|nr:septation protein IspZ [Alphaproteobacteria bacterium]
MQLLFALAPLVAFYVLEDRYGLRAAVAAGMVLAAVELAWTRWSQGRWSRMAVFTGGMVAVLGGLSLASDDPRFVLFSPVLGDAVFAALVAGGQLRGTNLVVAALREQDPEVDLHPLQLTFFDGLAWRFVANLVLHAALTAWSAGQDRDVWLFVSGPLQYAMMGVQVAGELAWARWVVLPAVEADEDAARAASGPPTPS